MAGYAGKSSILSCEKNQQFLLDFGALSQNLFLDFAPALSVTFPKTLTMLIFSGFTKRQ
jgi:hypothetical protein